MLRLFIDLPLTQLMPTLPLVILHRYYNIKARLHNFLASCASWGDFVSKSPVDDKKTQYSDTCYEPLIIKQQYRIYLVDKFPHACFAVVH